MRRALAIVAVAAALAGCEAAPLQPNGGSCVRASECQPGLGCVLGRCTNDLSGLEGGVVPSMDAGNMEVDAGDDAGDVPEVDAGPPPPPMDAGPGGTDAGPPPMVDAGPGGTDAGPPPMMDAGFDAGPPPMPDAGFDAGPPPMPDAGFDAGPPPDPDAGP
ncbi:MAG: hypothetical protein H6719_25845 [Sandaracinaceae bacterium]|nr:hypothetical protein [Sandaracinaceae bacterium]